MNKYLPLVLVACLAFLGGKIVSGDLPFDFGSIIEPIAAKKTIAGVYVIEEVTDRARVVTLMAGADWFNAMQRENGVKCVLYDDDAPAIKALLPKVQEVGGVAAIAVVGTDKTLLGIRKLSDADTLEAVEQWIEGVGKYAS